MPALFDVPGWSVPSDPVSAQRHSKKRRRAEDQDTLRAAQANLDKLIGSLGESSKKKSKTKPSRRDRPQDGKKNAKHAASEQTLGLTSLQQSLRKSLDGARFRMLNETLYKSSSTDAIKMIKEDPQIFEDYHIGFRRQVQSWPSNPVLYYISELSSYPTKTVIADFGCGDAALARALLPKNLVVLSFDLVSDGAFVIEADICSHVPLPGSEPLSTESTQGEAQVVDVVVCALSLMSTNWPRCISEAWRILKPGGKLKIAEVASRFANVGEFTTLVSSVGFKLQHIHDHDSHFTLFDFKKVARGVISEQAWSTLVSALDLECNLYFVLIAMGGKRHVLSHPVVNARLSQLRLSTTSPKDFREGVYDIGFVLGVEASRDLEEEPFDGNTPIAPFTGTVIKQQIGLAPILRAGLGMTDALLKLFPAASVYHLGIFREKVSLQPVEYYSKLPPNPTVDAVFLLDPLVATGGTACAALSMLLDWGIPVSKIKLLVVLASEPGLAHIEAEHPDLEIWVAAVDPGLTPDGLILPGLGDTGDRLFNTVVRV